MKKRFTILGVLLFLMAGVTMGQNYQVPNNTFEGSWIQSNTVPSGWHSFKDASGDHASTVNGTNYSSRETGHGTGSSPGYCCRMESHSVIGIVANGNITTGQIMVNALSTNSTENRNISDIDNSEEHNGYCAFSGRPDSLKLWCKFYIPKKGLFESATTRSFTASLKFHLHGNVEYYDHGQVYANTSQSGKIANVYGDLQSPSHSNSSAWTSDWMAFSFPVKYWNGSNQNTSPNLSNTSAPSYLLASFSTNKDIGGGKAGDAIFVDDIWFVYNKKLGSLVVGNTTLTSAQITTLNNLAYSLANGTTTNTFTSSIVEGSYPTYTYSTAVCASDLATIAITATPQSGFATATVQSTATANNPYAIVKVTHTDNSCYYFRIYFSNIIQLATPALAATPNPATLGADLSLSTSTSYPSGTTYAWSLNNSSVGTGNPCVTQPSGLGTQNYKLVVTNSDCTAENTIAVTVNPGPPTVQGGKTCGNGTVTLTAVPTVVGATCRWYGAATGGTPLVTATSYTTPVLTSSTTYYVSTYDANSGTESSCVPVTAQWYPAVSIPTSVTTSVSRCGAGEVELSANPGSNMCHWYSSTQSTTVLSTASTYKPTVTGSTDFYVSSYNTSSGCESERVHVEVMVKNIPSISSNDLSTSLCAGEHKILTATVPTGASIVWYDAATGGNTLTPNNEGYYYTPEETAGTYHYYAAALLDGCESDRLDFTVVVNAKPTAPTCTPAPICQGKAATLTASGLNGNDCRWYMVQNGGSAISTNATYTTATLNADATYYVAAYSSTSGCESDRVSVAITVNPKPNDPTLDNISNCGPLQTTLTAAAAENCTVKWYSDAQGANELASTSVTVSQSTTYYAANVNSTTGCRSTMSPMAITIKTVPANPTVNGEYKYCSATEVMLSATQNQGANIQWYRPNLSPSNTGNTTQLGIVNATTTYYVASELDNCYSDTLPVTVTINPKPGQPAVGDITLCAAGEVTLAGTPGTNGDEVRWYVNNSRIEPDATGVVVYNATGDVTLTATTYNTQTGCESEG
ncbi:MAG: hypothetical protein IJK85_01660, partial [Bacteroidales bacterium]|nr:hypothetical protein [Bacteroidales bacterium]